MNLKLRPSTLAYYFENGCPGYLISNDTLGIKTNNSGSGNVSHNSTVVSGTAEEGQLWQDTVLSLIRAQDIPVISNLVVRNPEDLYNAINSCFEENSEKKYLYIDDCSFNLGITVTEVNGNTATWSVFRPDLIHVEKLENGNYRLTIGDIKSSSKIRVEHKMQVAVYEYILSGWLKDDERFEFNSNEGFIYFTIEGDLLINENQVVGKIFDLVPPLGFLGDFFDTKLDKIVGGLREEEGDLSCYGQYLMANCSNCPKKDVCHAKAKEIYDIRLLPYISNFAQQYWLDRNMPVSMLNDDGDVDVARFMTVLNSEREYLLDNNFWKEFIMDREDVRNRRINMLVRAFDESYWESEPFVPANYDSYSNGGTCTLLISKKNDVAIYISADIRRKTGGDRYLAGYSIKSAIHDRNDIAPAEAMVNYDVTANDTTDMSHSFVTDFYNTINEFYGIAALENTDDFNLKIYVFDDAEKGFIYSILFDVLDGDNQILASHSKDILSYLQSEQFIVAEGDHPNSIVNYPMTAVIDAVRELYIIPAFSSYDMDSVLRAFGVAVTEADCAVDKLEMIVDCIQSHDELRLFGVVENFAKPEVNAINNPFLSKLHYLVLNEIQIERLASSRYLMWHDSKLFRFGKAILLRKSGKNADEFEVDMTNYARDQYLDGNVDGVREIKGRWVLVDHSVEHFNRALAIVRESALSGTKPKEASLSVLPNGKTRIPVSSKCYTSEGAIVRTDANKTLLALKLEKENTTTSNTALKSIKALDEKLGQTNTNWVPEYTENIANDYNNDYSLLFNNPEHIGTTDFTESQKETFTQFLNSNITLLQGPPGTGKTDFIARTLIAMARLHQKKMENDPSLKPLAVAVSANSHAAIDNVLFKIDGYLDMNEAPLKTYKCQSGKETGRRIVENEDELVTLWNNIKSNDHLEAAMYVIGCTNWFADKVAGRLKLSDDETTSGFDYIIIDEASQMSCYQLVSFMHSVNTNTKYLIVGDPLQLSSILKGEYAYEKDGEIHVSSSVYEFFDSLQSASDYKKMIREDFRMNKVILDYIKRLYHGYAPYNNAVASRRLTPNFANYGCSDNLRELMEIILNPEKPLVACYISGGNAKAQKQAEVDLCYETTSVLHQIYGETLADHYGVIIPHHIHINDVSSRVAPLFEEGEAKPIIDTVDKLQGQEKDIVLSSYGVSDMEQILREVDFIYSLNRLNVSLSRARKKSIVLMSDNLAKRPVESLSYDEEGTRMQGINFLCGLKDYVSEKCINPLVITLESGVTVTCYSVGFADVD